MQPYALIAIATLGVWMAGYGTVQAYSPELTTPTTTEDLTLAAPGMMHYAADRHPPLVMQYAADRHPPLVMQYAADRHPPLVMQYAADRHPPLVMQYAADRHPPIGQEPIRVVLQFGTETDNFVLEPKMLRLEKGKLYQLVIANPSNITHIVTAFEFGAAIDSISLMQGVPIEQEHSAVWYFVASQAGTYDIGCGIQTHKKAGMLGKIIVG